MKKTLIVLFIILSCIISLISCETSAENVSTLDLTENSDEEPLALNEFEASEQEIVISRKFDLVAPSPSDDTVKLLYGMEPNASLLYKEKVCLTQGMCVSDSYIFIAAADHDGNDYKIRKLDINSMELIAESVSCYNHANAMTYNEYTNELIICALDGRSGLFNVTGDQDYSFFVCDADTLELKSTVNIKDIVMRISPELCGVSEIAYDSFNRKYYVATHNPQRYIIVLNEDFTFNECMYMREHYQHYGLYGDMSCDGKYLYFCRWIKEGDYLLNIVDKFTLDGEFVFSNYIYGITHIESVSVIDGECYANFIDFSTGADLKLYRFDLDEAYIRVS